MVNEIHEEMIKNIFEFGDKDAYDIMIHRKSIVAVNGDMTISGTLKYMFRQNYSRFPVYEKDIDNMIGLIHLEGLSIRSLLWRMNMDKLKI